MKTEILEEIGFSKGEVKVYFALVELGQITIGPLSKKADVTPAKVYPILDKLIRKGLVSEVIKSGTKYFEAASPKRILDYLNEKSKKVEEQKKEIKEIIPMIEEKRKLSRDVSKAEVYQGFEGIRTLYNEILDGDKKNIRKVVESKIDDIDNKINELVKTKRLLQKVNEDILNHNKKCCDDIESYLMPRKV